MIKEIEPLITELSALVQNASAPARREMALEISRFLRQKTVSRVKAQQNPDGTPFAPRSTRKQGVGYVLPNYTFYYRKQPVRLKNVKDFGDYVIGFDEISNGVKRCTKKYIIAPDGLSWINGISSKKNEKMFPKLGTNRFIRVQSSAESAAIQFMNRAAMIARFHQNGEGNRPQRELLGFAPEDIVQIRDIIINRLAKNCKSVS